MTPPWHDNVLGNATDPLLMFTGLLLTICWLSGCWWILSYALLFVLAYGLLLLYALYLEHNARHLGLKAAFYASCTAIF